MINPLVLINQLFEMQQKLAQNGLADQYSRNFNRLYNVFEEEGYMVQDPIGETYSETRTDYEASITGKSGSSMKITRTIKPIVYQKSSNGIQLMQKGVVIAENKL
jgi:hypothetical protein